MEEEQIKILLIEDNPGHVRLIQEMLRKASTDQFKLESANQLSLGLERLKMDSFDVVLLDLGLPDSRGLDTLRKVHAQVPNIPVIVMTGLDDEAVGIKAVQEGAQDYLIKGQVEGNLLIRSIRYAIERKQSEVALSQSEKRYRSLVENARDVIFTLSADGTITSLNPAFEIITGLSRAEWIGKSFAQIIHPDDLPLAMEKFQSVLRGEEPYMFELRAFSKSGKYLVGEFMLTPKIENGKVIGMLGIARDITERKQSEEKLQKHLEELERFKKATIQRELRMKELRDKVERLEKRK